jgi:hypothetical protein
MAGLSHPAPSGGRPRARAGRRSLPVYGAVVGRGVTEGLGVTDGRLDGLGPGVPPPAGLAPGELLDDPAGTGARIAVPRVVASIQKIAGACPVAPGCT